MNPYLKVCRLKTESRLLDEKNSSRGWMTWRTNSSRRENRLKSNIMKLELALQMTLKRWRSNLMRLSWNINSKMVKGNKKIRVSKNNYWRWLIRKKEQLANLNRWNPAIHQIPRELKTNSRFVNKSLNVRLMRRKMKSRSLFESIMKLQNINFMSSNYSMMEKKSVLKRGL